MSQIAFPLVTSAAATNPFCWVEEPAGAFGVKVTASPNFNAVAVAENVMGRIQNTMLDIFTAGSFYKYSQQTGGQNFPFTIAVQPQNINFIKIGTNPPDLTTPTGTSAASYQFLMKYKQSLGTAQLVDTFMHFLGCRPRTTNITVSPQQKISVTMEWVAREIQISTAVNGGMTTPVIPTLASVTGPVLVDSDAGALPLTINALPYPTDGFTVNVDTGLIAKPYNGSGKIDASFPGTYKITGNINPPLGAQGITLLTLATSSQVGVTAKYNFKTGVMVGNMTGFVLGDVERNFPGNADSFLELPSTFECSGFNLATS
jgi:hypothetical protein